MGWSSFLFSLRFSARGFTDRAVKVLSVARQNAEAHCHRNIEPEHVLLALAAVKPGPGRLALERLGVDLARDTEQIAGLAAALPMTPGEQPSFNPATERLVAAAQAQSKELGHRYVGTEHLVLGLLRCGPCRAGDYLRDRDVTVERFRNELMRLLNE
jgi:ATP-dependent Clp protease ATP-binding subunit ClpC